MRVDLSNDPSYGTPPADGQHHAILRDPKTITEAGRRTYRLTLARARDPLSSPEDRALGIALSDYAQIAMFVEAWTLPWPIPQASFPDALEHLATGDFDELAFKTLKLLPEVFTTFSAKKEDLAADAPLDSPFLAAGAPEVDLGGDEAAERGRSAAADVVPGEGPVVPADQTPARVD